MSKQEATDQAIFTKTFHWSRKGNGLGFGANPDKEPQTFPADFITAAVDAKAAHRVGKDQK